MVLDTVRTDVTIRAVGFDLDYTLAVPTRDREAILRDAATTAGAPPFSRDAYLDAHREHLTGETRAPIFETLLEAHGSDVDPDAVAASYREQIADALVPVDGAEAFLAALRERYPVGLLTNGPRVAQRDKLATLGWEEAFDVALVTGELTAGKPNAAAFEALLDALGSEAAETAYVGDDVNADIGGARGAGLVPIQVVFEGGPDPDPRAAAHVERDELIERLPEILERL